MKYRALAACAALAIGFAACSDDDDDAPDGTELGGDLDTGSIAVPGTELGGGDTGAADTEGGDDAATVPVDTGVATTG